MEEPGWKPARDGPPAFTFHHSRKFSCPPLCPCVRLWPLGHALPWKGVPCWDMSPETVLADDCFSRVSHRRSARGESTAARPPLLLALISLLFPKGFCLHLLVGGPGTHLFLFPPWSSWPWGWGDSGSTQGRKGGTMTPPRQPPQR